MRIAPSPSGDQPRRGGRGGREIEVAADTRGKPVGLDELADGCPMVAFADIILAVADPAKADLAVGPERPERELDPEPVGVERYLAGPRPPLLVGALVEAALIEPQR